MIELGVIFALHVLVSGAIIWYLVKTGREERQELEDRLMEISKPEAAILHKAARDPEPAKIEYVDERREWELQRQEGTPALVGDED